MTVVRHCLPQLESIVQGTEASAIVEHGLFIRPGEEVAAQQDSGWGKGRVTLIGDAAHPMRPTGLILLKTPLFTWLCTYCKPSFASLALAHSSTLLESSNLKSPHLYSPEGQSSASCSVLQGDLYLRRPCMGASEILYGPISPSSPLHGMLLPLCPPALLAPGLKRACHVSIHSKLSATFCHLGSLSPLATCIVIDSNLLLGVAMSKWSWQPARGRQESCWLQIAGLMPKELGPNMHEYFGPRGHCTSPTIAHLHVSHGTH